MKRSYGLVPCGKVRVPKEGPGEATDEGTTQLQRPQQNFGDAITKGQLPRTSVAMEQSQLEPTRQAVCTENGRSEKWGWLPGTLEPRG